MEGFRLATALFLRLQAVVYFFAFLSLLFQVDGLIGTDGILPAGAYLKSCLSEAGSLAFFLCPSLFWLDSRTAALQTGAAAGVLVSLLAVWRYRQPFVFLVLYVLWLSFVSVGQVFLQYQWDALLGECGFWTIWLAAVSGRRAGTGAPVVGLNLVAFCFRWLLFRLVFMSGMVKLLSADQTYRNLTALTFHWFTQPLPTPVAWYLDKMPLVLQKISLLGMFAFELISPFFIFASGRLRLSGAIAIMFLQLAIAVSGNYCFFNMLAFFLCIFMLSDQIIARFLPLPIMRYLLLRDHCQGRKARIATPWRIKLAFLCGTVGLLLPVSVLNLMPAVTWQVAPVAASAVQWLAPYMVANTYGVFAVMTRQRHEIIIEGSRDGRHWAAYEFRYKPGCLSCPPAWIAPFQPRLDWQMWFAALNENAQPEEWFVKFSDRLLQGSPSVLHLLAKNPFPECPPKFLRADLYDYRFTSASERQASGNWWRRQYWGHYLPECRLETWR